MISKKKKCACFTIVKNEKYWLPVWLSHYKRFFQNKDIFILDHQSDDGSTDNLDVNVIPLVNDVTFDAQWLLETVKQYQALLLHTYEAVLFAEVDEIVYSIKKPLLDRINEFLDSEDTYLTCKSHEIIHMFYEEKFLSKNDPILENRQWWFSDDGYDKTLLSKIHMPWLHGFHRQQSLSLNYTDDLFLVHLRRADWRVLCERHIDRASWKMMELNGLGDYAKTSDLNKVMTYYFNIPNQPTYIEYEHKLALQHLRL